MAVLLVLQLLPNGNRRCIATSMIQQLHPVVMEAAMMRTRTDLKTGVAMECIMGGNDTCIWGLELSFLGLGFCSPVHLPCLVFRTVTSLPPAVLPRMACNLRDCACRFDIMEKCGDAYFPVKSIGICLSAIGYKISRRCQMVRKDMAFLYRARRDLVCHCSQ